MSDLRWQCGMPQGGEPGIEAFLAYHASPVVDPADETYGQPVCLIMLMS